MKRIIPMALLCGGLLLGAAMAGLPAAGQEPFTEIRIQGGKLASGPKVLRVKQGDTVRLRFTVDKEMEIHLHGYKVERKATPGAPAEMVFPARAAGRFPVEAHAEGAGGGHGHGAGGALLYLEVHPR